MNLSSTRTLARIARSDLRRHRGRSVLVVALVALPVAAMVAGIALYRTTTPTQERADTAEMGRADLVSFGSSRHELAKYLPSGSVVEPMISVEDRLIVEGARPSVAVRAMDLDGLAAGILTVVNGRTPKGTAEAAITGSVAETAAVSVGDSIELAEGGTRTVVGIVENPMFLADAVVLIDPNAQAIDEASATWLIGLPPGADPEAVVQSTMDPETGERNLIIESRRSGRLDVLGGDTTSPTILIMGSLALVEAALIASAAFAVSIRRRQRELGLLSATGATPRQLAGTVLVEGALLGVIACIAGVVVGLTGSLGLTPWLDDLTQRRNPPLVVDLGGIGGAVAVGFVAAMVAAIVPARTVARLPVLLALSGRRPPQIPARRNLWLGIGLVGAAAAMTVVGATMRDAGGDLLSILLLVGGAVTSVLGFGACAPWLLERLELVTARLPLAGRIAFRDTARTRSRTSPIVTAILAGCAAAVALGAWQTSRDEESLQGWRPSLYGDQLAVNGTGAQEAGELLRAEDGAIDGALIPYLGPDDPNSFVFFELPDARGEDGRVINLLDQCTNCNPGGFDPYQVYRPASATPAILATRGAEPVSADSIRADLAAGRAVVFSWRAVSASRLEISIRRDGRSSDAPERITLPVRLIHVEVPGGTLPDVFLPDATIAQLGLVEASEGMPYEPAPYVVRYDHTVSSADLDHARQVVSRFEDTYALIDTEPVRPGADFRLVLMTLVLVFAVSVTGIAIGLGEAESRPEQRSLLALGADPRLRRRIAASRAAVLALLAGILAVPAGLLPIWGIFVSRGSPIAVPALEIAGAVLALPILAIVSTWLLSRPIPDWAAFRSMGTGQ